MSQWWRCVGGIDQIPWLCRLSCFYFWVGDKWHYWKWLVKHLTMLISIFLILLFIFAWLVWIHRILRRRIWILIRYVICRTVNGSVFLLNDYFEALAPQHCCQCLNWVIIITSLLLRNDYWFASLLYRSDENYYVIVWIFHLPVLQVS